MRCSNCGNRVPDAVADGMPSCPNCGSPLGGKPVLEDTRIEPAAAPSPPEAEGILPTVEQAPEDEPPVAEVVLDDEDVDITRATPHSTPRSAPASELAKTQVSIGRGSSSSSSSAKPAVPGRLGHFVVRGKLGAGGMGEVLDGYDPQLDRRVAIKVLSSRLAQDEQFVNRFLSEARAVARVSHPNVASIFFADTDGDRHFFVMEFVAGRSLDAIVEKSGCLSPKKAIDYISQAVRGLAAASERGIVHRDIKPANLMVEEASGRVKVTDFGLAKMAGEDQHLTQAGSVMGSPHFMAPEQGRGEETDHRADIYSLGATLYYLLLGRTPYAGESAVAIILKHQEAPVPQVERAPPSLNRMLGKMMAKKLEDRYQSYRDLMTDILRLDKSGLLRDDIKLDGSASSDANPAAPAPLARQTPTPRTETPARNQALMARLDSAMKGAPDRTTTEEIRAASRWPSDTSAHAPDRAPADEPESPVEDPEPSLPLLKIVFGGLFGAILLAVLMARPWTWASAAVEDDHDPQVGQTLARLNPVLRNESPEVRLHAVVALGRLPIEAVEKTLIDMLVDDAVAVRREAVAILGSHRSRAAVPGVLERLEDISPEVRLAAAEALELTTGYAQLRRIDWAQSPDGLRRAVRNEFAAWLRTNGYRID